MFSRSVVNTLATAIPLRISLRSVATLAGNSHIYVIPHPQNPSTHLLTLLPTTPPTPSLAIGTSTANPPTSTSFQENRTFLNILQSVIAENAPDDPAVLSQASAWASTSGANLGSGGVFFSPSARRKSSQGNTNAAEGGGKEAVGGAANAQGGMGGAGRSGYIHVSDQRNPPDFGRIAWPEDIFGSLEVDGEGNILRGTYQDSGTYRVITNEGILGLSDFLRTKLVERLKVEEAARKNSGS